MSCEKIKELLEAHALEALDPAEQRLVEQHLAVCPACRRLAAEYKDIAALLPQALAEASTLSPPAVMKEQLLQAIQADTPGLVNQALKDKPAEDRSLPVSARLAANGKQNKLRTGSSLWSSLAWQPSRTIAVLAVLILLLLAILLGTQLTIVAAKERALQAELASLFGQQELVLEVVDSDHTVRRVLLAPEPRRSQPQPPYGKLFTRSDLPHVVAMVARLPQPPEGQAYHLWLADGGRLELAGLMEVNEEGFSLLAFDAASDGPLYEAAELRLQPVGSSEPSGELVLSWEASQQ